MKRKNDFYFYISLLGFFCIAAFYVLNARNPAFKYPLQISVTITALSYFLFEFDNFKKIIQKLPTVSLEKKFSMFSLAGFSLIFFWNTLLFREYLFYYIFKALLGFLLLVIAVVKKD